ncbi:MAG: ABC transporter ATP-binding protein/permease [Lachnospiraceae bacterium]|nr:ABC transporter ATP-binding protein/permease [Butyrivibrio sp.]MCM1342555.1 ABC transporter ATP-binding protein/permease [Muribaculaceae bacterium]MCM1412220.1 ABC transporter ATP-binding protein/permease [Lachnospiraceae bacterium]
MFVLKERKYNWLDMWRMPFQCAPAATVAVTAQKLITALANVFQVIVVAEFLDGAIRAAVSKSFEGETVVWFLLMLLIVSWKRVSFHIGNLFNNYVTLHGNEQISAELTGKRDRMEYYLLEDPKIEELSNRLTGKLEQNLQWNLQWFLNLFAINIPRIAGVLLIMSGYVWWLSLVVLALTVPLFFFSLKSGKKVYQAYEEAAVYERRHKYLFSVLTGRETTEERSLFGYTGQLNEQWHEQYEGALKQNIRSEMLFMGNSLRGTVMNGLLSAVVVLIMIPLTASGKLTAGIFISLVTSMYDLIDIMGNNTARAVNRVAMAQEYMKDFTAFAALPEREDMPERDLVQAHAAEKPIPELEELEFSHVTFRYPGTDADILKDFSMKLERGRHYAIVGENGAGKTTLIKLLTGLYREYEGEILYNGVEMRTFPREEWFRIFSCVFQDFARYYLSVEENICLGMGGMDFEEEESLERRRERLFCMESAAVQLDIHDHIMRNLKNGYQTRLGKLDEDSTDLSGGQWQRVAMARALMNDAPLLLLDEPTAALDPISESRLYEEFGEISRNRTTIFISHRLGSIKLSDHIFLLKDGCVREQGSHEELMRLQGVYAHMYETQQGWYSKEYPAETELE